MNLKSLAQRIGMVALLCMVGTAVFAQNTKTLDSGITLVKLSSTFTSALQSLNVTPGTVAPTRIRNGSAWFPVTGGAIDLDTAAGNIIHSGGLTLEAGGIKVSLQSFIIDTTGAAPVLTGLVAVNKKLLGRVPLFNLALPSGFTLPLKPEGRFVELKGVGVTLTSQAAGALNGVYSVSAFAAGLDIGTADVFAVVASPRQWPYAR